MYIFMSLFCLARAYGSPALEPAEQQHAVALGSGFRVGSEFNFSASSYASWASNVAPSRRLAFGFEIPHALDELTQGVEDFVGHTAGDVAAATGLGQITRLVDESQEYLDRGLGMVRSVWGVFQGFGQEMARVYEGYRPLQPVFESGTGGIFRLAESPANIHYLASFVQDLLGTSKALHMVGDCSDRIMTAFQRLSGFYYDAMAKCQTLGGRRLSSSRRLLDYLGLLGGLNFQFLIGTFRSLSNQAHHLSSILDHIDEVLGPLLSEIGAATAGSRRLHSQGLLAKEQEYQQAIDQVIPAWRGVEEVGIHMCPKVSDALGMAQSLKCRVQGFVGAQGILNMDGVLGQCPTAGPGGLNCPTRAYSAGVANWLKKYSALLGWFLAVIVACGLLGGAATARHQVQSHREAAMNFNPRQGFAVQSTFPYQPARMI